MEPIQHDQLFIFHRKKSISFRAINLVVSITASILVEGTVTPGNYFAIIVDEFSIMFFNAEGIFLHS